MKLYYELADWWHLFSPHTDYEEEANLYLNVIKKHKSDIKTGLELGSGGGNNAFYFKRHYDMTLTDLSENMINQSKKLNPDCNHIVGDMRYLSIDQKYDMVFIHDAIMYITTEEDLLKIFFNAKKHLNDNGLLFIAPDFFKETFKPSTDCDGYDSEDKGIRYLEWTDDINPNDNVVETDYVYIMRYSNGDVKTEHDRVQEGIFSKDTWEKLLNQAGFSVKFEPLEHSDLEPDSYFGLVCKIQNY